MENLYNEINELHKKGHNALANASGGVQRNGRGKLVEELVALVVVVLLLLLVLLSLFYYK